MSTVIFYLTTLVNEIMNLSNWIKTICHFIIKHFEFSTTIFYFPNPN